MKNALPMLLATGCLLIALPATKAVAIEAKLGKVSLEEVPSNKQLDEAIVRLERIHVQAEGKKNATLMFDLGVKAKPDLSVLVARSEDPRSEKLLVRLSKHEPQFVGCGEPTLSGRAEESLWELHARRKYHELLDSANTTEEKTRIIRQFISEHTDFLDLNTRTREQTVLIKKLLLTLEALSGADAVDLLVQATMYWDMPKQYPDALLGYARKIGRENALRTPELLRWIGKSDKKEAIALLKQWTDEETEDESLKQLISTLGEFPNAQGYIVELLKDSRPVVAETAAWELSRSTSPAAMRGVADLLKRRRKAGAPSKEIDSYEKIIKSIQDNLDEKKDDR